MVPGGISILDDPVNRIFPTDDSEPTSVVSSVEILYNICNEELKYFLHFNHIETILLGTTTVRSNSRSYVRSLSRFVFP